MSSSSSESELSEDEQVCFEPSGALKKGTILQKNGVDRKYFPPKEATKPTKKYRMYVFKDGSEKSKPKILMFFLSHSNKAIC